MSARRVLISECEWDKTRRPVAAWPVSQSEGRTGETRIAPRSPSLTAPRPRVTVAATCGPLAARSVCRGRRARQQELGQSSGLRSGRVGRAHGCAVEARAAELRGRAGCGQARCCGHDSGIQWSVCRKFDHGESQLLAVQGKMGGGAESCPRNTRAAASSGVSVSLKSQWRALWPLAAISLSNRYS